MKQVAAIIVTYNSEAVVGECLDALRDCGSVVVVDNASADGSVTESRKRPWVQVIANDSNRGFAAAVNQGAGATREPLLLILNPDAVVLGGLPGLAAVCERHGLAAGKLVESDGSPQSGFTIRRLPTPATLILETLGVNRLWPGNPVNRRYRYAGRDLETGGEAEQPAGAFLMIRRDVFEELRGFDESFAPVWFEDVDFARRAKDGGYAAQYFSGAAARHRGAHSVGRIPGECLKLYWYVSLLRYAAKHFRAIQFRVVCAAVAASCVLRLVSGKVGERNAAIAYQGALGMALRSLWSARLRTENVRFEEWSGLERGTAVRVVSHPAQR